MIVVLWRFLDHRFTAAHASEYLDGELAEADRSRVERHTSVCPECRVLLASLRRVLEALPGLAPPPSAGIADGVLVRLRHDA